MRGSLEYAHMSRESSDLPASQLVRWGVVGFLILAAVGLYFRHGRSVPPLDGNPVMADTIPPR